MKVNTPNPSQKARIVPPIPLERVENPPLEKGEYLTYKLRNNPTDDSSPLYELSVPFFGTGTPEQWLKFMENLSRVCAGQNVTMGASAIHTVYATRTTIVCPSSVDNVLKDLPR